MNVPNAISALRLFSAPVMLAAAWAGRHGLFLSVYLFCLLSDSLDGFLARRLGQESRLGAQLDSWGDFATLVCMPVGAALLWPDIVVREFPFIAVALLSYVVPTLFGFLKYGRLTSYHTWGAKVSAVVIGLALLLLLGLQWPYLFRAAVPLLVVEATEETLMTALLRRPHENVPSLWHALRLRAAEAAPIRRQTGNATSPDRATS